MRRKSSKSRTCAGFFLTCLLPQNAYTETILFFNFLISDIFPPSFIGKKEIQRKIITMKVLIVEDTQELATNLVRYLAIKGIQADISPDGVDGLFKAATKYYDTIILDINLPGKDGISVCRELRQKEKDVPIIMLTSRSGKEDIITGLDAGADDYLAKPFDYDILIARIEALTRRNLKNKSTEILRAGPYLIDIEKVEVRKIAASSPLTRGEL